MLALSRRLRGVVVSGLGLSIAGVPVALGLDRELATALPETPIDATLPSIVVPLALVVGTILFVAGVAALFGRTVSPRSALSVPFVGLGTAGAILLDAGSASSSAFLVPLASADVFVGTTVVAGTAIAPVVIGTIREHTPILLAGTIGLLAAVSLSPAPVLTLAVGIGGGTLAVGLLWRLDAESWRP